MKTQENICLACHCDGFHKMSCPSKKIQIHITKEDTQPTPEKEKDENEEEFRTLIKDFTLQEKYNILHRTLINLHTASWTGNEKSIQKYMSLIGDYSYSFTNSTMDDEQDERSQYYALKALNEG